MLDRSRKAADIAVRLHDELGQGAFSFVSLRVEEARQASDQGEMRRWNDVASELLSLDRCAIGDDRKGTGSLWRLMQRIEYYRHQAAEAERKAAAAPEAYRDDMLDLAVQWRHLALLADLQAHLSDKGAAPKDV